MASGEQHKKARTFRFLGLSALAHLQVGLVVVAVLSANPDACSVGGGLPLDPFQVEVVSTHEPQTVKRLEKEEKEEAKKDRDAKGQVVDLAKPKEERRPDKARFLSEYDSTVRKETRAKPSRQPPGALRSERPMPRRKATRAERQRITQALRRFAMRPAAPEAVEEPRVRLEKDDQGDSPAQPKPKKTPRLTVIKPGARKAVPAQPGAKGRSLKELQLSRKDLSKILGGRANDALPDDVEPGGHTLLNSKRWRFATFFNRVKRQVAQNWRPNRAYRRRDPTGNIYGFKDRMTVLRVKLTPKGVLKGVSLEKASGVGFLDDVAIRAFRLAQPFPNPPSALVDERTGMISFRFGFLFEISHRPSFKVFRFQ